MLMQWLRLWNDFRKDENGAIAIVFGLSAMVLMLVTGLAYDASRAFSVSSKVQKALDASALAAARMLDSSSMTDSDIEARAIAFFDSYSASLNMSQTAVSDFKADVKRGDWKVETEATVTVESLFGKLANISPTISFKPKSSVVYRAKKIEVVLALDITGSMDVPGKLDSLKQAAKDFVDALYAGNPGNDAIRVGLVPWASSVNAGTFAGALTGGTSTDGCVVERAGGDAYTNESVSMGGTMGASNTTLEPSYSCPSDTIIPPTDLKNFSERDSFKTSIDNLSPWGGTAGHIGAALGWYMLSPEWAGFWPRAPRNYDPNRVIKAIVLMTDGEMNTSYANGGEAYSASIADRVNPALPGTSGYQLLELCKNMTTNAAAGEQITIYSVAFQAPAEAETLLQTCAGPSNSYIADNSSELIASFKSIVEVLTSLRVTG